MAAIVEAINTAVKARFSLPFLLQQPQEHEMKLVQHNVARSMRQIMHDGRLSFKKQTCCPPLASSELKASCSKRSLVALNADFSSGLSADGQAGCVGDRWQDRAAAFSPVLSPLSEP